MKKEKLMFSKSKNISDSALNESDEENFFLNEDGESSCQDRRAAYRNIKQDTSVRVGFIL